jgi:hypothetical protein
MCVKSASANAIIRRNVDAYASFATQLLNADNFSVLFREKIRFSRELQELFKDSWALSRTLHELRTEYRKTTDTAQRKLLGTRIEAVKRARNEVSSREIRDASTAAADLLQTPEDFWDIRPTQLRSDKQLYTDKRTRRHENYEFRLAHRLCVLQADKNLRQTFHVRFSSRDAISELLGRKLSDATPKFVLRTDIEQFYESISHEKLTSMLASNTSLHSDTYTLAIAFLQKFSEVTGKPFGLPRGIGLSATLSEIYLSSVDHRIRSRRETLEYFRYVDDILVISDSNPRENGAAAQTFVKNVLSPLDLRLNENKTFALSYHGPATPSDASHPSHVSFGVGFGTKIEYLGYCYQYKGSSLVVDITNRKKQEYSRRITKCIDTYRNSNKSTADRMLLQERLRLLTSNYKLRGERSGISAGVFYSNSMVTTATTFAGLDSYMKYAFRNATGDQLSPHISFELSLTRATMIQISSKRLRRLTHPWRRNEAL